MSERSIQALKDMATRLRIHSVRSTSIAGSGHPTSCSSIADIMSVLFFDIMRYDLAKPRAIGNDRFILSKGHAAPILYAAWAEAGLFPVEELDRLRLFDCDLEGHPTPRLSFVDVATGSLGQGLSSAAGMAYARKNLENSDARIYCLLGDGEVAEGSVWEAASFASHYGLDNLCAIVDVNRLGQSEATMLKHHCESYESRFSAFGWNTIVVNGHDIDAVCKAFDSAACQNDRPTAIIAKTIKGYDFEGIADEDNWHGKPLGDKTDSIIADLQSKIKSDSNPKIKAPTKNQKELSKDPVVYKERPNFDSNKAIATRNAYGDALAALGADARVVGLDGDTKNSTFAQTFMEKHPERFIECFIAEQNLAGVGIGLASQGYVPFVSTFAAFLSRAFDQIRMAAISQSTCNFVGSHAGVSIGEDGPSQMALEDLAMFRTVPGCAVFYPCDAVSTAAAVELAANHKGITFIRTSRPATPVLYAADHAFEVGKANVVRSSDQDSVLVLGCGVTLFEALKAADELAKEDIHICVMDPFTLKPLDVDAIREHASRCNGKVITVEDHYPQGGLGESVMSALAEQTDVQVRTLAVTDVPRSGKSQELLDHFGISCKSIVKTVKEMV